MLPPVDSKAQKLLNFSSPLTPLEVIMLSVVEGMLGLECTESREVINAAIENLVDGMCRMLCHTVFVLIYVGKIK